jgi:hypothetical protein
MPELLRLWSILSLIFLLEMIWAYFLLGLRDFIHMELLPDFPVNFTADEASMATDVAAFLCMVVVAMLWPFNLAGFVELTVLILWLWR